MYARVAVLVRGALHRVPSVASGPVRVSRSTASSPTRCNAARTRSPRAGGGATRIGPRLPARDAAGAATSIASSARVVAASTSWPGPSADSCASRTNDPAGPRGRAPSAQPEASPGPPTDHTCAVRTPTRPDAVIGDHSCVRRTKLGGGCRRPTAGRPLVRQAHAETRSAPRRGDPRPPCAGSTVHGAGCGRGLAVTRSRARRSRGLAVTRSEQDAVAGSQVTRLAGPRGRNKTRSRQDAVAASPPHGNAFGARRDQGAMPPVH
jgi:hypothetical protein